MAIICITPICPGTILAPYSLNCPRLISEMMPISDARERNINTNRARLQHIFMSKYFADYEHVLLLDSDVVITQNAIDMLLNAWKPGFVPCANTKGGPTDHVVASCALIGRKDYSEIDYLTNPNLCQCRKLKNPFYVDGAVGYEFKNRKIYGSF